MINENNIINYKKLHCKEGYNLIKIIGKGSFAVVYLAESIYENRKVAIKIINFNDACNFEILRNEIVILLSIDNYHSLLQKLFIVDLPIVLYLGEQLQ